MEEQGSDSVRGVGENNFVSNKDFESATTVLVSSDCNIEFHPDRIEVQPNNVNDSTVGSSDFKGFEMENEDKFRHFNIIMNQDDIPTENVNNDQEINDISSIRCMSESSSQGTEHRQINESSMLSGGGMNLDMMQVLLDAISTSSQEVKTEIKTVVSRLDNIDKKYEKKVEILDNRVSSNEKSIVELKEIGKKQINLVSERIDEIKSKCQSNFLKIGQLNVQVDSLVESTRKNFETFEEVLVEKCQENTVKINNVHNIVSDQNIEILKLKDSVTSDKFCSSNSSGIKEIIISKDFSDFRMKIDYLNPMSFMVNLKDYLKRNNICNWDKIRNILDNNFENDFKLKEWWSYIKLDLLNFNDFEAKFTDKLWSKEIQRTARHDLRFGKYKIGGQLSLTEYFIHKANIAKHLTPSLDKEEILELLMDHYDQNIITASIVRNVKSADDFIKLLENFCHTEKYRISNVNSRNSNFNQNRAARNVGNIQVRFNDSENNFSQQNNRFNNVNSQNYVSSNFNDRPVNSSNVNQNSRPYDRTNNLNNFNNRWQQNSQNNFRNNNSFKNRNFDNRNFPRDRSTERNVNFNPRNAYPANRNLSNNDNNNNFRNVNSSQNVNKRSENNSNNVQNRSNQIVTQAEVHALNQ